MTAIRMTETEVTANFAAVLENLAKGVEVEVEKEHRTVAVIRPPRRYGRKISECLTSARASGSLARLDEGFGADVEAGIRESEALWTPPSWE